MVNPKDAMNQQQPPPLPSPLAARPHPPTCVVGEACGNRVGVVLNVGVAPGARDDDVGGDAPARGVRGRWPIEPPTDRPTDQPTNQPTDQCTGEGRLGGGRQQGRRVGRGGISAAKDK